MSMKLEQAARQALEALEICNANVYVKGSEAITALREALAEQAEQEPVAWMNNTTSMGVFARNKEGAENFGCTIPLYAAPVRTKYLTDTEIATLVQRHTIDGKIMPFALCEAVIAADREKNK